MANQTWGDTVSTLQTNGVEVWATRVSSERAQLNPSWREKEANMATTFQARIESQH